MHSKTKRRGAAFVVAGLGLAGLGIFASSASAIQLSGSQFEIDDDANLVLDTNNPGTIDWATVPQGTGPSDEFRGIDTPSGQTDNSYKGGAKEDDTCPNIEAGSIPNNKSDLLTFHGYRELGTPGFFNFAWSRVSDPSGTTLMDFEFNKSTTPCAPGRPNVTRTVGDLLVEYAIDQGGAQAEISGRSVERHGVGSRHRPR